MTLRRIERLPLLEVHMFIFASGILLGAFIGSAIGFMIFAILADNGRNDL